MVANTFSKRNHRTHIHVEMDVLRCCKIPRMRISHVAKLAKLQHSQVFREMDSLESRGLLLKEQTSVYRTVNGKVTFHWKVETTLKGIELLKAWDAFLRVYGEFP